MAALTCDICGGKLVVGTGGVAVCDSCGMKYSKERIQEKIKEKKGTVEVSNFASNDSLLKQENLTLENSNKELNTVLAIGDNSRDGQENTEEQNVKSKLKIEEKEPNHNNVNDNPSQELNTLVAIGENSRDGLDNTEKQMNVERINMALCSNCGEKIKEGVKFCPSCGRPAVNTGFPPGYKPKDWTTTLLLCIFLGWLGGHRFYVGKIGTAILNIIVTVITFGIGSFIWFIIDLIMICTFKFKDKHGYPLKHKSLTNVPTSPNMPVYDSPSANIGNNGGTVYDKAENVESTAQNLLEQETEKRISSEKIIEFKAFVRNLIETNGGQLTGDGAYWENIPEKICNNATKAHAIPNSESILIVFNESILGSGKAGMAFTDWGIRYKSAGDSWRLSWNDISAKYTLVKTKTGDTIMIKPNELLLKAKSSNGSAVDKPINLTVYIDYDILAAIIDKSCQIFTGRKVEVLDNTVVNKYLRKREANGFLDYLQEENKSGVLGKNAILNTGKSIKIENFSGSLNLHDDEEIIVLFEGTQKGSGENGLAFTSWGERYRDNVNQKKWDLSWKELGEKCTFHNEEKKSFRIRSKQDDLAAYEIDKIPYMPNTDILEILFLNGCMIMNGEDPYAVDPEA